MPDHDQVLAERFEADEVALADLSRRQVRALVFHFLYAADAFDYTLPLGTLIENFNQGFNLAVAYGDDVESMVRAVLEVRDQLDEQIKPLLHNWRFDRLGVCTKLVLRMALWELDHGELDPKIIINEAIELAKCFAEDDAYKFVNGLLDEAVKNRALNGSVPAA